MSRLLILFFTALVWAQDKTCEPWCSESCKELNGNIEIECGTCSKGSSRCYPGADGWTGWEERSEAYQASGGQQQMIGERLPPSGPVEAAANLAPGCSTLRCKRVRQKRMMEAQQEEQRKLEPPQLPAAPPPPPPQMPSRRKTTKSNAKPRGLGPRHDGRTAGGEEVQCELRRVTHSELLAVPAAERAAFLDSPTIVTDMIDEWPAHTYWQSPRNFSDRYGHHRILAKRVGFGWARAQEMGVHQDAASVSLAELVQRTHSEHIIVLDEYGKSFEEDSLLADLMSDFTNPALFESASQCRVFSFGGGHRGVQMMQHGVAWLGLVTGAKLWHVAPPHLPRPSDRTCENDGRINHKLAKAEGVSHCLLLPGEVIFVPDSWWHATCNLDPYTIGVGGQLWRPSMQDLFEADHERTVPVVDKPSYDPSTFTKPRPLYDEVEAIVFDPDEEMMQVPVQVGYKP